jgi:zinc finger SWIM domain-containing protein 3
VKDFIDEHNHPYIPGIRKHKIIDVLEIQYGGYDKVGCTTRDLYYFCRRYKAKTIAANDAQTIISYLRELQRRDPDLFFKYMVDGEEQLKGLFWGDSQCLLDYEAFGDVVVFDSTYKTNRYNLPLVPFVGANHHPSTAIFGCEIISHENIESYV